MQLSFFRAIISAARRWSLRKCAPGTGAIWRLPAVRRRPAAGFLCSPLPAKPCTFVSGSKIFTLPPPLLLLPRRRSPPEAATKNLHAGGNLGLRIGALSPIRKRLQSACRFFLYFYGFPGAEHVQVRFRDAESGRLFQGNSVQADLFLIHLLHFGSIL